MKKNLMFIALLSAGVAFNSAVAQSIRPLDNFVKVERTMPAEQAKVQAKDFTHAVLPQAKAQQMRLAEPVKLDGFNFMKAPARVAENELFAYYVEPVGALHMAMDFEEGLLSYPNLVIPSFADVTFLNASTGTSSWTLNEMTPSEVGLEEGTDFQIDANSNLVLNMPLMGMGAIMPTITVAADNGVTESYYYGKNAVYNDLTFSPENCYLAMGLSLDALATGDILGHSGQFFSLDDNNFYGSMTRDGVKCSAVMSLVRPAAPLYIESMEILVSGPFDEEGNSTGDPIPANGSLTLTLYRVSDDGVITDEVIATSTATLGGDEATITPASGMDGAYVVHFDFYDVADDGFREKIALTEDKPFAAVITGFDQEGYDAHFPFTCDPTGFMGTGYVMFGDKLSFFSYNDLASSPVTDGDTMNATHLMLQMNASYTCFNFANRVQEDVVVPVEGGMGVSAVIEGVSYNDIDIYSSYPLEDAETGEGYVWYNEEELPDWIKIGADDRLYNQYGILMFMVEGEALPAGVEGRAADITLYTLGNQATFRVVQGDVTSISTVEDAQLNVINNGTDFELSYAEGIRGVQVVNVAGQVVADYALDGTSATIPASALAKGLYILKFDNGQTVKVMK